MANPQPSRSDRKGDDADVSYEIAMPFANANATIYLFAQDDGTAEVLIGHIPEPYFYYDNYDTDDREKLDQHAIAGWILSDAARVLEQWDYETSDYKTGNPNYHLRDVYFECDREEIDDAVLAAKRFLTELEEKVLRQRQQSDGHVPNSPSRELFGDGE